MTTKNNLNISSLKRKNLGLLKKMAENGNAECQYELGKMYRDGQYVFKNAEKALYWFRQAEKNGCNDAIEFIRELEPLVKELEADSAELSKKQLHDSDEARLDPDDPNKLNMSYYLSLKVMRKAVFVFPAVVFVIRFFAWFCNTHQIGKNIGAVVYFLAYLFLLIIGFRGASGIVERKPNCIYLCRLHAWMNITIGLLCVVMCAIMRVNQLPMSLMSLFLVFYGGFILMILNDDYVNKIYPVECRTVSRKMKRIVCGYIGLFVLLYLSFGWYVDLFTNYYLFWGCIVIVLFAANVALTLLGGARNQS